MATEDGECVANKVRLMRNFGFAGYDNVIYPGTNGKMTEICAAMGLTNLESLDEFVAHNRENYLTYSKHLAGDAKVKLIEYDEFEQCNYQYIVMEVLDPDPTLRIALCNVFMVRGVLARRYSWPGVHRMQPYRSLYPHAGLVLPRTQAVADRVIVLPTGSAVDSTDVARVCDVILDVWWQRVTERETGRRTH